VKVLGELLNTLTGRYVAVSAIRIIFLFNNVTSNGSARPSDSWIWSVESLL